MSLEATIQENTNAIRDLIEQLKLGHSASNAAAAAQASAAIEKAKEETTSEKKPSTAAQTEAAAPTKPTAEAAVAAAPETKDEPSAPATYEDVKQAVTKLAQAKGRDAVVAIFKDFGVAKGPDLKPEQYDAFVKAATETAEA